MPSINGIPSLTSINGISFPSGGGAPAGPPLYILVNSFVAPDYKAKTNGAYQSFTTVVTVDP
jgi:hypothetical protein